MAHTLYHRMIFVFVSVVGTRLFELCVPYTVA